MKKFLLMIGFLTRIPVPAPSWQIDDEEFKDGIVYFPVVGFVVGIFCVAFYYIGNLIGGPFLASVASVLGGAFITGGLHLDGLGDTFDGLYSNRPKAKMLEIMKDSRLGTNGALAIMFTVLIKTALIYHIPVPNIYPVLVLMPSFSRLSMVFASRFSTYAKGDGLGNIFIGKVSNKQVLLAVMFVCFFSLLSLSFFGFLPIVFVFSLMYVNHIKSRIDGMTGDTLGALCELSELVFLLYFSIIL